MSYKKKYAFKDDFDREVSFNNVKDLSVKELFQAQKYYSRQRLNHGLNFKHSDLYIEIDTRIDKMLDK